MTTPTPGWYPDQANPQVLRWWDGNSWSPHTQPNPQHQPPQAPPPQQYQQQPHYQQQFAPQQQYAPQQYQQQPQQQYAPQQGGQAAGFAGQPQQLYQQQFQQQPMAAGGYAPGQPGGGPLYTAEVLLIAQKNKVFGVSSSAGAYEIFDTNRQLVGTFREPETLASKAMDKLNPFSEFKTKDFKLTDASGTVVLQVDLPMSPLKGNMFKPKFEVKSATGAPLGMIERRKVIDTKFAMHFTSNGVDIGEFKRERRQTFVCRDMHGRQLAEFAKRTPGQVSFKEVFTQDDSYVLQRPQPIPEPLGSMVLVAACALDVLFFEKD